MNRFASVWIGFVAAGRSAVLGLIVAILAGSALRAAAGEPAVVVKIQDMMRASDYQVLSPAEYKDLQKDLQQEEKFFKKAEELATKDWKQDELNKNIPFPTGRVFPRKIVGQPMQCASKQQAEDKLSAIRDADSKKAKREGDKLRDLEQKNPNAAKALKEKETAEKEKELVLERAKDLIQKHLEELTGKPAEKGTFPEAKPAGEKAPEKQAPEKDKGKEKAGKALDKAL
jgi:hypothetical protein